MKSITTTPILAWTALALAAGQLLLSTHVTAAGYKKADKTGASIAGFRDEIVNIKKEVDTALLALDKVLQTANTDPRKAFKDFDKAVPKVDSAAQKTKNTGREVQQTLDPVIAELNTIEAALTPAKNK